MAPIRIGTRASDLALWQTSHVAARLRGLDPSIELEVVRLSTVGDDLVDVPLERAEGTGFFTSTIERALLAGSIDLAVHSYKDLPTEPTAGLAIGAVLERAAVEDVLCARDGRTFSNLPRGGSVGTSSPRRTAQLRLRRPDLEFVSLRGNVPTRLGRIERRELDGAILARAGLERLARTEWITEIFSVADLLPAPAQGALAVQVRAGDHVTRECAAALDHVATRCAVDAERAVLRALRGGCSVPVGAFARASGSWITLDAGVFDLEGLHAVRTVMRGDDPQTLGKAMADWLLEHGADRILEAVDRTFRLAAPESP
jgi:hydroxymethylbilane synthase